MYIHGEMGKARAFQPFANLHPATNRVDVSELDLEN